MYANERGRCRQRKTNARHQKFITSWTASRIIAISEPNRPAPLVGAVRGNAVLAVVLFANGVFDETILQLKSRDLAMKMLRNVIPSPQELVTVHKREPINRVIDRLRKLDDHDFSD